MFLRNAWYCAAWSAEVSRKPLGRTLLKENIVLYRKENGTIVALGDVCPHRFAPLHEGRLCGDAIACRYHGLQFGEGGACVHNPHDGRIPPSLRVKAFPLVERHGSAWIWMGDAAAADPARIPDFSAHDDPGFRAIYDFLPVKGSYQLVCDNLLDLSHTQYLHAFLTQSDFKDHHFKLEQNGDTVTTINSFLDTQREGFTAFIWPDGPERVDTLFNLRWDPPGNMLLTVNQTCVNRPGAQGRTNYAAQLATPETQTTCHYFWSFARNYRLDEEEFDEALRAAISGVFRNEDEWMISLVQKNMGAETDLLSMKPIILPTDACAVRARRIMKKRIEEEQAARSAA
jgi:vanillate O-demethylase monooxygenase subunit